MKRIKHSKIKNTGLVFELLVRQVASDVMNNNESIALSIVKKFFGKNTELSKELKLYRSLHEEKFKHANHADQFIDAVIRSRATLNESLLKREKYNLINEIQSKFDIDAFFKSRVNNYKTHATIYKLFEYAEADGPKEYTDNRIALTEHVTNVTAPSTPVEQLTTEDKDVRILTSKLIIERFNKKYQGLGDSQKALLKEYINNVTNSVALKQYVTECCSDINTALNSLRSNVNSKVIRIKLNEVGNLTNKLAQKHVITDKDVLTVLRYYELISELKKLETNG